MSNESPKSDPVWGAEGVPLRESFNPPLGPVDQQRPAIERMVIPTEDIEKHSYNPPLGPVDRSPDNPPPPSPNGDDNADD